MMCCAGRVPESGHAQRSRAWRFPVRCTVSWGPSAPGCQCYACGGGEASTLAAVLSLKDALPCLCLFLSFSFSPSLYLLLLLSSYFFLLLLAPCTYLSIPITVFLFLPFLNLSLSSSLFPLAQGRWLNQGSPKPSVGLHLPFLVAWLPEGSAADPRLLSHAGRKASRRVWNLAFIAVQPFRASS